MLSVDCASAIVASPTQAAAATRVRHQARIDASLSARNRVHDRQTIIVCGLSRESRDEILSIQLRGAAVGICNEAPAIVICL